jgi:DnaK suppressor protein
MNKRTMKELAHELSRRRAELLQDKAGGQHQLNAISEQQESEFEEAAQKDRITRLTSLLSARDQQKIREIDAALERIAKGEYGKCAKCHREIGIERLRALPSATLCINCAAARENKGQSAAAEEASEKLPVRDLEEFGEPSGPDIDKE